MMKEFTCKNGFKLLVKEDRRSTVAVTHLVYKVGSSYEHNGITGISHCLEHMMFRGTKHYSTEKFIESISEKGGHQNAFTGQDYTGYYQVGSVDQIEECFRFEADRMMHLTLNRNAFKTEMQVIIEERILRVDDDPHAKTLERFNAIAFSASNYHNPVIGWMQDLEAMTIEDIKRWYDTWYVPNNAVAIVVGNVNAEEMQRLAVKYFSKLKHVPLPTARLYSDITPRGARSLVIKLENALPWLIIGYNVPVLKTTAERWKPYGLLVLGEILAGSKSARLHRRLVVDSSLIVNANYSYSPFQRADTTLNFYFSPKKVNEIDKIKQYFFNELINIHNNGPTAEELKRVKAQLIAGQIYHKDSIVQQAKEIGAMEAVGLSWRESERAIKAIQRLDAQQIKEVAREYCIEARLVMADLLPM